MSIVPCFQYIPLLWVLFRVFNIYHYYGYCSVFFFQYTPLLWALFRFHYVPLLWYCSVFSLYTTIVGIVPVSLCTTIMVLFCFFIMYHYYGYCSCFSLYTTVMGIVASFHYIPLSWILFSMSRFGNEFINSMKTFLYSEHISSVKIALNICAKGFFSCTVWKLEAFQSTK